jgi:hypothetical protein
MGQNRALEEQNEELRVFIASKEELMSHWKMRLKRSEEINSDNIKI